ncbi:MAG: hypothetical protein ABGY71_00660 [bacterium]|nr:DUF4382 domain-containing protein [Planctomycetota bacterium]HIL51849.1 DUF4382 domain-containing protein [Planctomycetota bacterium]
MNTDYCRYGTLLTLTAAALALAGCGGGTGTGGVTGSASGAGNILVKDAPVTGLLSFTVTIDELRLVDSTLVPSANLLVTPVPVEFLGLQTQSAWLTNSPFPAGTYGGAQVVFDPASIKARAKDGSVVPVTVGPGDEVLGVSFDTNLQVSGSTDFSRVLIDLDLTESLSGSVLTSLVFEPSGSVNIAGTDEPIDEVRGIVGSFSETQGQVVIDAFVDDDMAVALGKLTITVPPGIPLMREDGALYLTSVGFFSDLVANSTLLEVHGTLGTDGRITADAIEVEDSAQDVVKLEGIVANTSAGMFDFRLVEIERGAALAEPVLASLGDPLTIEISHDGSTDFFHEDGTPATGGDLRIGQGIKIYLSTFASEPFPANRIRINFPPASEGVIVDVAGLPGSIEVNINADEPLVTSGLVTAATNVIVDLSTAEIFLNSKGKPTLAASSLLVGLEIQVEGNFDSGTTTVTAGKLKTRAGRLRGDITAANSGGFSVALTDFKDPFGNSVDIAGPYTVLVDPGAEFKGDEATSVGGVASLFSNLGMGEVLTVRLKGIGTANPNEILAYEIEVRVE